MKILFSVFALAVIMNLAKAQNVVTGTVKDESGKALYGATIIVSNTLNATISDKNGGFSFKLANGKYKITARFLGYADKTIELEVPGSSHSIPIQLFPSEIVTEDVVISATRANSKTPVTYSEISKNEIQNQNFGQDVPYLLSNMPSVVTTSDAGAGIGYTGMRIRGTNLSRINVTINGVPYNDAESHNVYWVDLPDFASSIESIQVQRGVGTSSNGAGAFGASVNIQTLALNKEPYVEGMFSAGSFGTVKKMISAGTGLLKGKFCLEARYSDIQSNGYIDRASADLSSYYLAGTYYHKNTLVKVIVTHGKEKTYLAWDGVPGGRLDSMRTYNPLGEYTNDNGLISYYDNETDNYKQTHYNLLVNHEFSKTLSFNGALHFTHGNGYYEQYKVDKKYSGYALPNPVVNGVSVKKTDFVTQKWLNNDFYGGIFNLTYKNSLAEITWGVSINQYDGQHFGKLIWSRVANSVPSGYQWYKGTGVKTEKSIFQKAVLSLDDVHLFADVQIRYIDYKIKGIDDKLRDITTTRTYEFFNPKAGATYDMGENASAYLSFSMANREPTRSDIVDAGLTGGSPTSERLFDLEAGYNYKSNPFTFHLNCFYMNYHDQLVLTGQINDVGDAVMRNIPKSYRSGVELSTSVLVLPELRIEGTTTLSQNKINEFTEYVDDWDTGIQRTKKLGKTDISFSPSVTANGKITYKPCNYLEASWICKYVGKQYIDNTSNENRKLDAYWVNDFFMNLSIPTKYTKNVSFKFQVNNVFNHKYESNAWVYRYFSENVESADFGYFPQAGRNFMLGLVVKI